MQQGGVGIVFVLPNFFFYFTNNGATGLRFDFPASSVNDLEVINNTEFEQLIKTFIDQSQMPPTNIMIVLSNAVCFDRDFSSPTQTGLEEEIKLFLENVPFENLETKRFAIENGVKVVVANKDFYTSIKSSFENKKFSVDGVSCVFAIGDILGDQTNLTPQAIATLFEKYSTFKQNSFLASEKPTPVVSQNPQIKTSKINIRLMALSGIFILLIIILLLVVFISMKSS